MSSDGRTYDIIIVGATGYTGALTAEHIAEHLPKDLRWAIAGRSKEKLEKLAEKLRKIEPNRIEPGMGSPFYLPSLHDVKAQLTQVAAIEVVQLTLEEVKTVVAKARVCISAVGPYRLHGEVVVDACIQGGTHYLDT